jgi:hypothetical protein
MPLVDVIVVLIIVVAILVGLRQGLARSLPIAGFAVGAVLGSRLPLLLGGELDSGYSLVAALPGALLVGAIAAAIAERFAGGLARRMRGRDRLDAIGGGLLAGAAGVVVVWMLAPVVAELRSVRDPIDRSEVLAALNGVLTPAGPDRTRELAPVGALPTYEGGDPDVAAGDPGILFDRDVAAAERSVMRIHVNSCRGGGMGSGWVAARGIVVTNAHVISGSRSILVQPRGSGASFAAVPIWFDGAHDIALLRVARLPRLPPLPIVREPRGGTSGAILGFPQGRRAIRRARLGPTTDRLFGRLGGPPPPGVSFELAGRPVTLIRGRSQPGGSGGPVVDARGHVLATVFAGNQAFGTLGVPNRFVRAGLRKAGPRVATGSCSERSGARGRR